jgi:hypothetical protein
MGYEDELDRVVDQHADMIVQMVLKFIDSEPWQKLPREVKDMATDEAIDRLANLRLGGAI